MTWPRTVKALVFVATLCAAWLVAFPARADAPQCDRRGAITFAPAPQLQAIQLSIDVGPDATDACGAPLFLHLVSSGDGVAWDTSTADPVASRTATPDVTAPGRTTALSTYPSRARIAASAGVTLDIERPPRP